MDPCAGGAAPPRRPIPGERRRLVEEGVVGYATDPAETPGLPDALRRDAESLRISPMVLAD